MIKPKEQLIALLQSCKTSMTGKEIAKELNVSDRTIRAWIKDINHDTKIIESTASGYRLKEKNIKSFPSNVTYEFGSAEERQIYMIERILFAKHGVNLYDLAEQIYVSYSTIEKDIKPIKNLLKAYDLTLKRSKGTISIVGTEWKKRNLIKKLFINKNDDFLKSMMNTLCENLKISFSSIEMIVENNLNKYNLFANKYAIQNIVIHIIINLTRIKQNLYLNENKKISAKNDMKIEYECAKSISKDITDHCHITLNNAEIKQLEYLISTKSTLLNIDQIVNKEICINTKFKDFTIEVIKQIKSFYYIDLMDNDFLLFFSLHLENVIYRIQNYTYNKNPFSDQIYIHNPLIYDIAVFISSEIYKKYKVLLNRDEITFIALHVGAIVEKKQKNLYHKVLIFCDNYYYQAYNYDNNYSPTKLQIYFEIVSVIHNIDKINNYKYDFIINTSSQILPSKYDQVNVGPLLTEKDIHKILDFKRYLEERENKTKLIKQFQCQ